MNILFRSLPRASHWRVTAVSLGLFIAAAGAISNGASEPVRGAASTLETALPWLPVHSIWFFSNRTEIDPLERAKFATLAAWVGTHAGSEVGISLPAGAIDPDSAQARTNLLRVSAIREAMVAAGIPAARIHVGVYGGTSPAVDRRVVIFVRAVPDGAMAAVAE